MSLYIKSKQSHQRWFTLVDDANHAEFADVALKAHELLAGLKLNGIDPHTTRKQATVKGQTLGQCFRQWLDLTGKRRARAIAPRTRDGYERLFALHIEAELGSKFSTYLTREEVAKAIEKVKKATTDVKKGFRGVQSTKALKLISSVCEWAVDQDWILRNLCRGLELPAPIHNPLGKQSRPPTNGELRQL